MEWTLRTVRGTLLPKEDTFFPFEILSVLGKQKQIDILRQITSCSQTEEVNLVFGVLREEIEDELFNVKREPEQQEQSGIKHNVSNYCHRTKATRL